jgi:1,4-alpha-glucan branching enzyme
LHDLDFQPQGFDWIDCQDSDQSVLSYIRRARDGSFIIAVQNFTPVPRHQYRLGVPQAGTYAEIFNSDAQFYGGGNVSNGIQIHTEPTAWMGHPQSIAITLPPLSGLILQIL